MQDINRKIRWNSQQKTYEKREYTRKERKQEMENREVES